MSTLKSNITAKRIAILAQKGEQIFHTQDLANFWNINNLNTLRHTLKRYCDSGLLFRIYRGFYSILPVKELDPLLIGAKALHRFCYLSLETILYRSGYISQKIDYFTFLSEKSLKFNINGYDFKSRKLDPKYLYQDEGIEIKNGIRIADIERAIADMLYFNPYYHFDKPVNWQKIRDLQKKIGYPLTPNRYDADSKTI